MGRLIKENVYYINKNGKIILQWLGTAGFEIKIREKIILIDPFLTRNERALKIGLKKEDIDKADYIFVTHGHFDHSMDVAFIGKRTGAKIIASEIVCKRAKSEDINEKYLFPVSGGEFFDFNEFKITVIKSRHIKFDIYLVLKTLFKWDSLKNIVKLKKLNDSYPLGDTLGYLFTIDNLSFVHFGSAGYYDEEIKKINPDIALIPLQGRTDIHRVSAVMTAKLNPKLVILHHFDNFYPPISQEIPTDKFVEELNKINLSIDIKIPNYLEEFRIN